ncbi:MAG: zinc-dependent metalloprotease [Acidimicrobiales bacterium]
MSGSGPPEGFGGGSDDPFRGMPFFGDLARMISQQGPVSWDAARQLAVSIASGGTSEPNVDPAERMKVEQLIRVADLHVAGATGLSTSVTGRGLTATAVNRGQWVAQSTDAYRPLFERLAGSLGQARVAGTGDQPGADPDDPGGDPMGAWLGQILQMMAPMMLGMTAGSMLGHLAQRSFGQYDLPVPRPPSDELILLTPNIHAFGREWSLPDDDLLLWVCVHEVAHHAVLGIPHVRQRLSSLLAQYAEGFQPDPGALEQKLGDLPFDDPSAMGGLGELQSLLGDPEVLLGAIQSPAQRELLPRIDALVTVIVGYVDCVMDRIGGQLISSYPMLTEALRRQRVEADPSDRFVEKLLGLELTQARYDRGSAFVDGVVERAGPDGIEPLWRSERELPTPAEVDAPGLWLARIELPDD